jgi:hypothetical protein
MSQSFEAPPGLLVLLVSKKLLVFVCTKGDCSSSQSVTFLPPFFLLSGVPYGAINFLPPSLLRKTNPKRLGNGKPFEKELLFYFLFFVLKSGFLPHFS